MNNNRQLSTFVIRATLLALLSLLSSADLIDLPGGRQRRGTNLVRDRIARSPDGYDPQSDVAQCPPDQGCGEEYVTYRMGSATGWPPVVISAPHGGTRLPDTIPNRGAGCWDEATSTCIWSHTCGVKNATACKAATDGDNATFILASLIRHHLCKFFNGHCPSLVNNNLGRFKFDGNREKPVATFGVPELEAAHDKYEEYVQDAKGIILRKNGAGLLFDIHGHRHSIQRAELGYLLNGTVFDSSQRLTNASGSSIRGLAERFPNVDFDDLIRGNFSFGAFVEKFGYPAVPSPANRGPGKGNLYFRGGYLTRRHGSESGGSFDAIQIESAVSHRESDNIKNYALALARAIRGYVCHHYQPVSTKVAVGCQAESLNNGQSRVSPIIAMHVVLFAAISFVVLLF